MADAPAFVFLGRAIVLAIHEEQIALHGGGIGIRNEGLLDTALSRPVDRMNYDHEADYAILAADSAFAIAKAPPFIDGNKRTAFVAMVLCMRLNGMQLNAGDADALVTMLRLAAGELSLDELAAWIRAHAGPA